MKYSTLSAFGTSRLKVPTRAHRTLLNIACAFSGQAPGQEMGQMRLDLDTLIHLLGT